MSFFQILNTVIFLQKQLFNLLLHPARTMLGVKGQKCFTDFPQFKDIKKVHMVWGKRPL